jgi:P27 family predicted phage terminase small subunit
LAKGDNFIQLKGQSEVSRKMAKKAVPIDLLLIKGNKHLTKKEIEKRKQAEESLRMSDEHIDPPEWLDEIAKKEFERIAELLKEVRLVTEADIHLLATYCDAYSDYVKCTELIQKEGLMVEYTNKAAETNKVPHPLMTKKKQLFEQMKAVASEFGLSPSARAKLAMPKKEEKEPTPEEKMFGDV